MWQNVDKHWLGRKFLYLYLTLLLGTWTVHESHIHTQSPCSTDLESGESLGRGKIHHQRGSALPLDTNQQD